MVELNLGEIYCLSWWRRENLGEGGGGGRKEKTISLVTRSQSVTGIPSTLTEEKSKISKSSKSKYS